MTGTVTWAGLDVHARSTHGAAINVMAGELRGRGSALVWRSRWPGWAGCLGR